MNRCQLWDSEKGLFDNLNTHGGSYRKYRSQPWLLSLWTLPNPLTYRCWPSTSVFRETHRTTRCSHLLHFIAWDIYILLLFPLYIFIEIGIWTTGGSNKIHIQDAARINPKKFPQLEPLSKNYLYNLNYITDTLIHPCIHRHKAAGKWGLAQSGWLSATLSPPPQNKSYALLVYFTLSFPSRQLCHLEDFGFLYGVPWCESSPVAAQFSSFP